MNKLILIAALCCFPLSANAGIVTLDFSTGIEGFTMSPGALAGESIEHSTTVGGGSLKIVTAGGDRQNVAVLDLDASSLWTDYLLANQFTGTLSYDVTIFADEIDYVDDGGDETPDWFESRIVLHTENPAGGDNWDSNKPNIGLSFPMASGTSFTQTITMNFNSNGITGNDGDLNSAAAPGWGFLRFGSNNDNGADGIEFLTTYLDNIVLVATPEPGSFALFAIALGMGFGRRRQK